VRRRHERRRAIFSTPSASCASCWFPISTTRCRNSTGWSARRRQFDLVVLAGDQLDISSTVSLDAQSVVILRYLALLQAAGRVVIGSGNHDLTGPDAQGEQAALWLAEARAAGVPTDGDSLTCGDTLVTICPWWDGPLGRADVAAQLAADAGRRPKRWIWVYHWPPLGSPTCWTGKRHYGDADLNGWIVEHEPDWSSPATSTSRRSSPPARGPIASARPGCSTPAARSARCRAMSTSISPAAPRRGDR
jgi:hypothetical protein